MALMGNSLVLTCLAATSMTAAVAQGSCKLETVVDQQLLQLRPAAHKFSSDSEASLPVWLELSRQKVTDGKLIVNYYTGALNPDLMEFTADGQMNGTGKYAAWGFTKEAWANAGLTDLNGAWTMRYDFLTPQESGNQFNEFLYLQFDRGKSIGQSCNICFSQYNLQTWNHDTTSTTYGSDAVLVEPAGHNWKTFDLGPGKFNTPYSMLISRDGTTGYVNVKLYERETSALKMEIEIRRQMTFTNDVPVAFYLNNQWNDWQRVGLVDASDVPSMTVPGSGGGGATPTASGDPHLQNILGEKFAIRKLGAHTMLSVPRGAEAADALLHLDAVVESATSGCSSFFITSLGVAGRWLGDVPALAFSAGGAPPGGVDGAGLRVGNSSALTIEEFLSRVPRTMAKFSLPEEEPSVPAAANRHATTMTGVLRLGPGVAVNIHWVSERTPAMSVARSLWLSVTGLDAVRTPIGGLLGADDHSVAAKPDAACAKQPAELLSIPLGKHMIASASMTDA